MTAVEIRPDEKGGIDEICAKDCAIHVERLDAGRWYMDIEASDGSHWQFWFGSRATVEFDHYEITPVAKLPATDTSDPPFHPPPDPKP